MPVYITQMFIIFQIIISAEISKMETGKFCWGSIIQKFDLFFAQSLFDSINT